LSNNVDLAASTTQIKAEFNLARPFIMPFQGRNGFTTINSNMAEKVFFFYTKVVGLVVI
jgi:hypothetical protein